MLLKNTASFLCAIVLFFLNVFATAASNSIEFVTSDGRLSNVNNVSELLAKKISLPTKAASKNSVRIIGSTGSKGCGKSTLLNRLYGCDLQVHKQLNNGKIAGGSRGIQIASGSTKHEIISKKKAATISNEDQSEGTEIKQEVKMIPDKDLLIVDNNMIDFREDESSNSVAGKTIAFTGRVCDVLIYNIWANEIGRKGALKASPLQLLYQEALIKHDQKEKNRNSKIQDNDTDSLSPSSFTESDLNQKTLLIITLHDYTKLDDSKEDSIQVKKKVKEELESIWVSTTKPKNLGKISKKLSFSDLFDVEVLLLPNPIRQATEYNNALLTLKDIIESNIDKTSTRTSDNSRWAYSKSIHKDGINHMVREWEDVLMRDVTLLPSRVQMTSYFAIDSLFNKFDNAIDKRLNEWRYIVDSGHTIPKFGEQATTMYSKSLDAFAKATQPYIMGRPRLLKYKALKEKLTKNLDELVKKQVVILQQMAMKKYKAGIIPFVNAEKREDSEKLVQSKIEQWFTVQANSLLIPDIYPVSDKSINELTSMIQEFSSKWPGSPAYNVVAMKNLEKNSKKKKGKPGVSFGCQLVSLLRFSGMGNFQGYGSYNAGIVQFIFGAQNDRDLQDSTGTGMPPPWLKIQPKVSIDVDM